MDPIEEQLLDAIAGQARLAYAVKQLAVCEAALQLWQQRAEHPGPEFSPEGIQHEIDYYTLQIARWQQHIAELAPEPYIIRSFVGAE